MIHWWIRHIILAIRVRIVAHGHGHLAIPDGKKNKKKARLVNQILENEPYSNYSKMKFFSRKPHVPLFLSLLQNSGERKNSYSKVVAREKSSILLLIEMKQKSI